MDSQIAFRTQTIEGVSWSIFSQIAFQGISYVIGIVLARILAPADYGLFGMALVFTGFTNVVNKIGLAQSLIYRQELRETHKSSAFWISLLNGLLTAAVVVLISPWVANYYQEPRVRALMVLIGVNYIVGAFGRVPNALLRRKLDFRNISLSLLIGTCGGGVVGILMAVLGFGVWSLVFSSMVSILLEVFLQWWVVDWRPKLSFDRQSVKELFGFSANLSAYQSLTYWVRNVDNLLVGKYLGSVSLGYYSRAYNFMLIPAIQVADVIGRVMWSALARIQEDKARIREILVRSIAVIALITMPMMFGAFILADKLILMLVGEKWSPVAPVFRILCGVGMLQSITSTGVWIFQATGRTDVMFRWHVLRGLVMIGAIVVGISFTSIEAVALAILIVTVAFFYFDIRIPGKIIELEFRPVLRVLFPIFISTGIMAVAVWLLDRLIPETIPVLYQVLILVGFGCLVYFLLLKLSSPKVLEESLQLSRQLFGGLVRRPKPVHEQGQ